VLIHHGYQGKNNLANIRRSESLRTETSVAFRDRPSSWATRTSPPFGALVSLAAVTSRGFRIRSFCAGQSATPSGFPPDLET
jgi:hypothetical protein